MDLRRTGGEVAVEIADNGSQTLFLGTALATVLAGVLVAFRGLPTAAVEAAAVAAGVAVLGLKLGGFIQRAATA